MNQNFREAHFSQHQKATKIASGTASPTHSTLGIFPPWKWRGKETLSCLSYHANDPVEDPLKTVKALFGSSNGPGHSTLALEKIMIPEKRC